MVAGGAAHDGRDFGEFWCSSLLPAGGELLSRRVDRVRRLPSTSMNTVTLPKVPTPVIHFVVCTLVGLTGEVPRKIAEEEAIREVVRAVNEFTYAQEVES